MSFPEGAAQGEWATECGLHVEKSEVVQGICPSQPELRVEGGRLRAADTELHTLVEEFGATLSIREVTASSVKRSNLWLGLSGHTDGQDSLG